MVGEPATESDLVDVPAVLGDENRLRETDGDEGVIVGTLRLVTKKPWAIDPAYFASVRRPLYLLSMAVDGMRMASASFSFGISGTMLLLPRRRVAATSHCQPASKT